MLMLYALPEGKSYHKLHGLRIYYLNKYKVLRKKCEDCFSRYKLKFIFVTTGSFNSKIRLPIIEIHLHVCSMHTIGLNWPPFVPSNSVTTPGIFKHLKCFKQFPFFIINVLVLFLSYLSKRKRSKFD